MRLGVGLLDRRPDLGDVGILIDEVMRDAHVVEDRLDDAHAIARRLHGVVSGSWPSSPTIMQIGWPYSTATPRMALMELRKPVYWISVSARLSQ